MLTVGCAMYTCGTLMHMGIYVHTVQVCYVALRRHTYFYMCGCAYVYVGLFM